MFKVNNFDKLLDKATSNLRLDPDWPTILQICDLIRQNDTSPKYAVAAVKKKLYSQNPHQAMFALLTLESIVKNCGSGVHEEVASKAFCEMLRDLVKTTQHENLRNKILELIQAWAFAFRNSPKYRAVQDTVNILKAEGFKFPTLWESDAMFSADTAPEWADGEVCHRCRVAFSLMVRRHHCRACGQVFCQQCSSKTSTLPKFGIEKEVRVCDACFDKVSRPPTSTAKLEIVDTASDYGPTQPQKRTSGGKTAEELQEEEELQLALALSQSEAEHKEKERKTRSHIVPDPTPHPVVSPPASVVSASPEHGGQMQASSELSRYLDRNYWEQRVTRDASAPTAPSQTPAPASLASNDTEDFTKPLQSKAQDDDAEDKEIDEFVETLKSQVEIFVNRMKSDSSRGRSIANDTAVQTLFMNITAMHSKLLRYIQQQDDKRVYLESLQDKVSQIRDSRAALDTLRAEHAARVAAAAEAAERARQLQMAAKLHAMRKKKHEYLQYQRQLALQRVQEQEREMQMRQEQQKHQYMMSANSGYFMPNMSMPQFQQGYNNQPMYGNPQFHPQMMQTTTEANLPMPSQPQSQATMHMGVNPMSTAAQSMPQLTNTYAAMSTTTPNPGLQSSVNQPNLRPGMGAQVPMHPMMMQMHQMRLPGQPAVHQMTPQGLTNGQNIAQNGQLQKNVPNQQVPNSMMPPMTTGQQNIGQMYTNPTSIQMQNMRMPLMANQGPMPGYMNPQNNNSQQPGIQNPQSQIPGQQMPGPSQSMMQPGQNQGMSNHIPNIVQNAPQGTQIPQSQAQPTQQPQAPQMSHGQPMGQQMMPGMQMQNIPNQAPNVNHGQPMPYQQMSQHMPPQQMNMPNQPPVQQMQMKMQHPNSQQPNMQNLQQPAVQHPNMQQPNMQQPNVQQSNMQQPNMQQPNMQQSNMQQPNMQQPNMQQPNMQQPNMQQPNMQQPNMQQPNMQQPNMQQPNIQQPNIQQPNFGNQNQSQPAQTPNKSEHNNNTAELISFD